jgi:hypothetical protein
MIPLFNVPTAYKDAGRLMDMARSKEINPWVKSI